MGDLGVKAAIYAPEGIPEYWVINLKKNILIVFRDPVDEKYQSRQEFTLGIISPLAFPDVARCFADTARVDVARLLK